MLHDAVAQELIDAQWLFSPSDLEETPTVLAGLMKPAEETKCRRKGVSLIYKVGEHLQLLSHVLTTSATFFHRFFMRRLMRLVGASPIHDGQPTFAYQDVALAALYLACKVEESYRKLDDIVARGLQLENRIDDGLSSSSSKRLSDEAMLRQGILWAEERLLETLCFDLIVEHPQKYLLLSARRLGVDKTLTRIAFAHLHDAFRDPVCTLFEAPVLAAGVFALACSDAGVGPNSFSPSNAASAHASASTRAGTSASANQNWLQVFDVSAEEIEDVTTALKTVREQLLVTEPPVQEAAGRANETYNGRSSTHASSSRVPQSLSAAPSASATPLFGDHLRTGTSGGSLSTSPNIKTSLGPLESPHAGGAARQGVGTAKGDANGIGTPTKSPLPAAAATTASLPSRPPSRHGHASSSMLGGPPKPFGSGSATDEQDGTRGRSQPHGSIKAPDAYTPLSPVFSQADGETEAEAGEAHVKKEAHPYVPVSPPGATGQRTAAATATAPAPAPKAPEAYVPVSPPQYHSDEGEGDKEVRRETPRRGSRSGGVGAGVGAGMGAGMGISIRGSATGGGGGGGGDDEEEGEILD